MPGSDRKHLPFPVRKYFDRHTGQRLPEKTYLKAKADLLI